MRTHVRFITAAASLFVLAVAFGARADTLQLQGRVPFAFMAGERQFAPGICTVHRGSDNQGVLIVRGQKQAVILLTQGASSSRLQDRPRLVFRRYGHRYFLREIWFAGSGGRLLPETKAERHEASVVNRTASLESPVTVEVALD
jgi:hypothetical protein